MSNIFGWNYPAGSMRGSGIYSDAYEQRRECPTCGSEQDGMYSVNDWGSESWHCDTCGKSVDLNVETPIPAEAWDWDEADYEGGPADEKGGK